MKTILPTLTLLALAGSAFAGEASVTATSDSDYAGTRDRNCPHGKSAGTPGAYYHSNFGHNAIMLCNDTPDFMTFFTYCGDMRAPNHINLLIRNGAQVYETVVPPYTTSFTDQRARHYWVGSLQGKWRIDMMHNRIVHL